MKTAGHLFRFIFAVLLFACKNSGHDDGESTQNHQPMDSMVVEQTRDGLDTTYYASARALQGLHSVWYQVAETDTGWVVAGTIDEGDSTGKSMDYADARRFLYQGNKLLLMGGGYDFWNGPQEVSEFRNEGWGNFQFQTVTTDSPSFVNHHFIKRFRGNINIIQWTSGQDSIGNYYISHKHHSTLPFVPIVVVRVFVANGGLNIVRKIVDGASHFTLN